MTRRRSDSSSGRRAGKSVSDAAERSAGPSEAAGFSRVRRDHAAEIAQDYVELIAKLIRTQGEARTVEIARRLGVSHVTVTRTIARLQREGLVQTQPYRSIHLTERGAALAEECEARHELLVKLLRKLGVNQRDAEHDAEGMEHHLSAATLTAIRHFVDAGT